MLDKSIEFHSIIMKHPNNQEIVEPTMRMVFQFGFMNRGMRSTGQSYKRRFRSLIMLRML